MKSLANIFIIVLMLQLSAGSAGAQSGYQPVTPLFDQNTTSIEGMNVNLDKALGQLMVQVPTDNVSVDQLQSIIAQFPGVDKMNLQFPNMSQLQTSPAELLNLQQQFTQAAGGLGFGAAGLDIPTLVLSSIANDPQLSGAAGQAGAIAMLPITNLKNAMSDTLSPILQQMGLQQTAGGSWVPVWLSDFWAAICDFVMPYYTATVNWIGSWF